MPAILKYTHANKISRKIFLPFSLKKKWDTQKCCYRSSSFHRVWTDLPQQEILKKKPGGSLGSTPAWGAQSSCCIDKAELSCLLHPLNTAAALQLLTGAERAANQFPASLTDWLMSTVISKLFTHGNKNTWTFCLFSLIWWAFQFETKSHTCGVLNFNQYVQQHCVKNPLKN